MIPRTARRLAAVAHECATELLRAREHGAALAREVDDALERLARTDLRTSRPEAREDLDERVARVHRFAIDDDRMRGREIRFVDDARRRDVRSLFVIARELEVREEVVRGRETSAEAVTDLLRVDLRVSLPIEVDGAVRRLRTGLHARVRIREPLRMKACLDREQLSFGT